MSLASPKSESDRAKYHLLGSISRTGRFFSRSVNSIGLFKFVCKKFHLHSLEMHMHVSTDDLNMAQAQACNCTRAFKRAHDRKGPWEKDSSLANGTPSLSINSLEMRSVLTQRVQYDMNSGRRLCSTETTMTSPNAWSPDPGIQCRQSIFAPMHKAITCSKLLSVERRRLSPQNRTCIGGEVSCRFR